MADAEDRVTPVVSGICILDRHVKIYALGVDLEPRYSAGRD